MKKLTTLTILLTALTSVAFGQITTTKVAPKTEQIDATPYDSTENFLGEAAHKYVGQELYLNGLSESLRKYGYDGFCLDFNKNIRKYSNTYNPVKPDNESYIKYDLGGGKSHYYSIVGKYFNVLEIIKHPKASESEFLYGKICYFKLREKESKNIVYYEYDSRFEHSFPFIVVGFFEKQKSLLVGQEFVFTDRILKVSSGGGRDIKTGEPITIKTGEKWKCKDLTIEETYYSLALVVENSIGETTTVGYDATFDKRHFAYTAKEANNYRKKFGDEDFEIILQGKVKIGMTKEMCKLSWGEPKSINETITSGKKSEQWVYSDNYLYFDNGILTAIQ